MSDQAPSAPGQPDPALSAPCAACGFRARAGCDRDDCPQLAERDLGAPRTTLSLAVDPGFPIASDAAGAVPPALQPGALPPSIEPAIPPELDARLNARERRTVWHMVAGLSYAQALDAQAIPKRAAIRDTAPPPTVLAAVDAVLQDIARQCGASRAWIVAQTVALYRRAAQAEEVTDRKGRPTGIYRFDGATAARCLELLGKAEGVFRDRKPGQLDVGDVAALLAAVAQRGRGRLVASQDAGTARPLEPAQVLPDRGAAPLPEKP